ncbi:hypothetical protein [Nitrosopumilus sp.]|uniref:hypothetical protein n=1 Tax=Nitrosopumilus sp. TaxID=2024843 RepID=UPI003B5B6E1C
MFFLFGTNIASGQDIQNIDSSVASEETIDSGVPEWYPDLTRSEGQEDSSDGDPHSQFISIDGETFERQHLLTGKPIEDTSSFVGAVYAYVGMGFVAIIIGFFVVKKAKNRNKIDSRKLKNKKRNSRHKK